MTAVAHIENPALPTLRGLKWLCEKHEQNPSPDLIRMIHTGITDVMSVLMQRDPVRTRLDQILVMMQLATRYTPAAGENGSFKRERAEIVEHGVWREAIRLLHNLETP